MTEKSQDFIAACRAHLESTWQRVILRARDVDSVPSLSLPPDLIQLIQDCLTCNVKSYHYVLPTQLLAKTVNPSLDAHCLQAAYDRPGAFDARTVAHKVIVPFDQDNYRVLGGAPEPYVNNPLRVPAVTREYRAQQKAKAEWDKLVAVLNAVQDAGDATFAQSVLEQTLLDIYGLLSGVVVTYPTPNRISLKQTQQLVRDYLGAVSGGERMEAICTALFRTVGEFFGTFDDVRREKVNASDASSRMLGDIECWSSGRVILLVEVKDRSLSLTQMDAKLDVARAQHISELLFIAKSGKHKVDAERIELRIQSEFSSGQNIYVENFDDLSLGIFILLSEIGRVQFLDAVGKELDRVNAEIMHRRAWAEILRLV